MAQILHEDPHYFIDAFFKDDDQDKLRNVVREISELLAMNYKEELTTCIGRMLGEYNDSLEREGQNIELEWILTSVLINCASQEFRPKTGVTELAIQGELVRQLYEFCVRPGLSGFSPDLLDESKVIEYEVSC
jgi:hypothetical protein